MKVITYTPDLSNVKVLKDKTKMNDVYFYQGHPAILLSDFKEHPEDMWILFQDYLSEKEGYGELYDQNGSEYEEYEMVNADGLVKARHRFDNLEFKDYEPIDELYVELEGYIIHDGHDSYFSPTKVSYDPALFIKTEE